MQDTDENYVYSVALHTPPKQGKGGGGSGEQLSDVSRQITKAT